MENKYYLTSDGELYHYGVPGMKWGIRRSRETLSKKASRHKSTSEYLRSEVASRNLRIQDNRAKSAEVQAKNAKYESKLAKAEAMKNKYDLKLAKASAKRNPNVDKIAKYTAKSIKYNNKILKAKSKLQNNKYEVKALKDEAWVKRAEIEIRENDAMATMFNNTITAMDKNKIKQGRLFMQYVTE